MATTHLATFWSSAPRARPSAAPALLGLTGAIAGAAAVLLFQHGTLLLLHAAAPGAPLLAGLFGEVPPAFSLRTGLLPFLPGLPGDLLWGGAWGAVLGLMIGRDRLPAALSGAMLGGLVLATIAVMAMPLARLQPIASPPRELLSLATLVYAAWGWGTALMLRLAIRP